MRKHQNIRKHLLDLKRCLKLHCYPVFKFTKQSDMFNVFRLTTELQCLEHAKDHDNKFSQSGLVSYKVKPVRASFI